MAATVEYQRAQDLELYNACFKNDFTLINNILSQPLELFPNNNIYFDDGNRNKKPLLIYANPNLRVLDEGGNGWTALLLACSKPTGAAQTVRMLLERSFACDIISSTTVVPNLEQKVCKIFAGLKLLEDTLGVARSLLETHQRERKSKKEEQQQQQLEGKEKSTSQDDDEALRKYQQGVENAECDILRFLLGCTLFQGVLPNIANSICHPSLPPSPRAPPNNVSNLHLAGQNGCADVIFEMMDFLASESTTTTHLNDDISDFLKQSSSAPSSSAGQENNNNNNNKNQDENIITSALLRWVRVFLDLHFFIFKARKYPINAQDVQGATAAFMAAQNNSADCVKLLIEGSNKQQETLSRLLSRYEKTREDFLSVVAKSFSHRAGFGSFMNLLTGDIKEAREVSVVAKRYVPVLNLDLCLGSSGAGPLHIACERGHLATLRALLCLDNNNNNNKHNQKNDDLVRKNIETFSQDYEYRRKGEELFGGYYYNYGSKNNFVLNNNNNNFASASSLRVQPANVHQKLCDNSSCIFVACVASIPLRSINNKNIINSESDSNNNLSTDQFALCIRTILEHEKQTNGIESMKRLLDFQKPSDKTSAVFAAVNAESTSCLTELIRYDANVDIQTADGVTPLFLAAASHGNPTIVRLLLLPKIKPSPVGKIVAPINDNFAASSIGGQANPNLAKSDGATPIFVAAQQRNIAALKAILENSKADVNLGMKPSGFAPLHVACDKGYADVVAILLDAANVNCNVENEFGLTPIHLATQRDHVDVVRVMIDKTRNMKNPVDVCKAPRDPHPRSKKINNNNNNDHDDDENDGPSPIFFSAFRGQNVEILELLLSSPTADPNVRKNDGATPVFATIQENRPDFLQVLLNDPRTDPNLGMFSKNGGAPPIFVACVRENLEVLKLLVQDAVKNNNRTRVHQKVLMDSSNKNDNDNNNDADCFILCIQHKKFAPLQLMLDEMPISFRRKVMIDVKTGNEGFLYASSMKSTLGIACCEHDNAEALKMILLLDESTENEKRKQKLATSEREWRNFVVDFLSKQNALGMTTFFAAALHSTSCLKLFVDFIEKELRRCMKNNNNGDDDVDEQEKTYVARLQQLLIAPTNDNSCPLFAATMAVSRKREGAIDRIKLLLSSSNSDGTDSSLQQNQNPSANFVSSVIRKNIDLAKSDGATSLFMAIQMHANEAAKLILKQGNADPASCLVNKSNCLMIAAEVNNLEMVQAVLDSYENENEDVTQQSNSKQRNNNKSTTIRSRQELKSLIQQRNEPFGFNAILVAAANGRTEIAKLLIEKGGANVNDIEPHEGTSAVFLCAQNGHVETLKLLLKYGADPNLSKKNSNASPLIVACHLLRKEVVQVLLSSLVGVDNEDSKFRLNVQQCDSMGGSALHHGMAVATQCRLILEKEFSEEKENEIVKEKKLITREQWNLKRKEVEDNLKKALEIVDMLKKYF